MAIAEVILRIKDESSKTLSQLTTTSEGYDDVLKQVADSVAKEEAAEKSRAAALGLTISQLRQVDAAMMDVMEAEKAATSSTSGLGDANWQTAQGAQSLKKNIGDVVQSLVSGQSPMQVFTQQSEGIASALAMGESPAAVLKQALGGIFSTIGANIATLGTLTAALGVAAVAYRVYGQEADRITEKRAFERDVAESLRDSELQLRDARIDQDVATKKLSETEGKILDIRNAALDNVRQYATENQKKIDAINAEIEASKKYLTLQHGIAAAMALVATVGSGDTARRLASGENIREIFASNARSINESIDAVTGLDASTDDAKGKIDALNAATMQEAANIQAARKATEEATKATKSGSDATKAATAAEKERSEWLRQMRKGIEEFQAAQSFLQQQAISDDPLAQEYERYEALIAKINEAAKATGDLELAEAALNAARLEHFRNTGAQGAPTNADTAAAFAYDQNLGTPSQPVTVQAKPGITAGQGIAAASSLGDLVKLDPTGISMGVYAGMKAAIDIGKGGGALGDLKTLVDGLGAALPGLAGGLSDLLAGLLADSIPALVNGITDALVTLPGDLIGSLLDAVPTLIEALIKNAPRFMLELATLAPRIGFELIKELVKPDFWVGIADALVQGIGDGLTELWTSLLDLIAEVLGIDTSTQTTAGAFDKGGFFMEGGSADKAFGGVKEKGYKAGLFDKGGFFDRLFTGNTMPAYDVGSDYIARSGLAMVHEGEAVVPAHGASQAAILGRAAGGGSPTYVLNGVIAANVEELVRTLREAERQGVSIG